MAIKSLIKSLNERAYLNLGIWSYYYEIAKNLNTTAVSPMQGG